jgi:hypothetical protein
LPKQLLTEPECVILIISAVYGYEMYQQLQSMNLPDSVSCYSLPLIMAVSVGSEDEILRKEIFSKSKDGAIDGQNVVNDERQINKIIHSFWFSGEKKPELYQSCLNSWKKFAPDYEIRVWDLNNYDYNKNRFVSQAIREKKWAFAADYARLDVINEYGGIYFDMDVELIASPDQLLPQQAFFTFDTNNDVELAAFGAIKGNQLIKSLLELYKDVDFCDTEGRCDVDHFCQPRYIRETMRTNGIVLDGSLQVRKGMVFLPRKYFVPLDNVVYLKTVISNESIAIHHTLAGWKDDDYRRQRIENNRELLKIANRAN